MAKILKPILLITISDPEPAVSPSGGNKGYNGLGVHRKEVENQSGIAKLEDDLTPRLGGDLDIAGKDIKNTKQVIFGNTDLFLMYVEDYTDFSNYPQQNF